MPVKKVYLFNCLIALFGFAISLNLLQNYTYGDQVYYHIFYERIAGISFWDVGLVAKNEINSSEPLTWFILWLGSNLGIDKNVWISFLNVFLMTGLFALLMRHKAPWYVIFLIFTNFYFLVLITSAERLKISYILIIFGFLMLSRKRYFFLFLTPLTHLQAVIFLAGLILASMNEQTRRLIHNFKLNKRLLSQAVLLAVIASPLIFLLKNGIISKLSIYANSFDIGAFANIIVLLLVATIATTNKLRMMLAMLPMFFAIAMVGADRVNMVAVTLALGILMFEQRLKHPLVLLLLLYFSFKSIPFISNVYAYGDGFYMPPS